MRRSMLFLPGNTPNIIVNGDALGADNVILDLEDAVSPDQKDAARILVRNAIKAIGFDNVELTVRINSLDTPYWKDDLEEIVPLSPDLIMPTKVNSAQDVLTLDAAIAGIEKKCGLDAGTVKLIPLIETAQGLENAAAIAAACPRVAAIFLGAEDRTADLRCPRTKEGTEIFYARSRMVSAARAAGVKKIYKIGGAQAIAAMAFGTETIPRVDKITGPGNIFVTLAEKEVYGNVDIDMLAGPSEILIVADKTADPVYTAADMLSQAEHDPLASSIVITDDAELAAKVETEVEKQLLELPRREIAQASIARNGLIVVADDMRQAIRFANVSAPEHLELLTAEPFQLLPYIRHAGAVFLGAYSPEPLGDYFAGPNHVLPTGGTARYYSVLNVETFMKRTSIISYTQPALQAVSEDIIRLAENEGLQAHANAIRLRRK